MDYIFTNGHVLNLSTGTWESKSLLTHNGRIACIDDLDNCRKTAPSAYEIIDLKGKLLLPAFMDTHTHFVEYAKKHLFVSLSKCRSLDAIHQSLTRYRDNLPYPASWILGDGWDRNLLDNPLALNRHFLDQVFPDMPVVLTSKDYHCKLCNTKALKLAGITARTADPYAGRIERDALGFPTGMLYETAGELVTPYIKTASDTEIVNAIKQSIRDCYKMGLIGFHSLETLNSRNLLLQAYNEGMQFRLIWHFQTDELEQVSHERSDIYPPKTHYKTWGMKIFGDGTLGSQTAGMFDAYPDNPDNLGLLRYSDEELLSLILSAAKQGFPCSIHAIGNRCVHQALAAIRESRTKHGFTALKHRIEHVQAIRDKDILLMKQLEVCAAVQPLHLAYDVPMIDKLWFDIQDQVYSFNSMLKQGVPLAFGSDSPIESINPFLGIYSAIERRPALNLELPAFRPDESISPMQAIHGYTLGAAAASQDEDVRGSLAVGKLADLLVLEDFRFSTPEFWLEAVSRLTMIQGEIVYWDL